MLLVIPNSYSRFVNAHKAINQILLTPGSSQTCLSSGRLRTAGSYLLVLHNLEQLDENNHDAVRLLKAAMEQQEWHLCRQLLRFLHSMDETGAALQNALSQVDLKLIDDEV